jgi:glycine cleavage system H protein
MVKVDNFEVAEELYYSTDYMWVKIEDDQARIGITDYAQKMMKDINSVELPSAGETLKVGDPFGMVESMKAVRDLTAPLSGTIDEVNEEAISNPALLNDDPYGEGWLLVVSPINLKKELKELMDFDKAVEWHKKLIKEG